MTMTTTTTTTWTPDAAAAAGAKFLDDTDPTWFRPSRIDLSDLDLGLCDHCIRGQLYGDWPQFYREQGKLTYELGFDVPDEWVDERNPFVKLEAAWRDEIARRRLAVSNSGFGV